MNNYDALDLATLKLNQEFSGFFFDVSPTALNDTVDLLVCGQAAERNGFFKIDALLAATQEVESFQNKNEINLTIDEFWEEFFGHIELPERQTIEALAEAEQENAANEEVDERYAFSRF